jgi:hypothetical protein
VAGYHVARERDEDGWWCLVDAGAHGGDRTGHAHTDLGHVELALGTRPIVADPGSLVYTGHDSRRGWDRSLEAHATLAVTGAPLDQPSGAFGWQRTAPTPETSFTPRPDGAITRLRYEWRAASGVRLSHERQVALFDGGGVVIVDWLTGAAGLDVTLSWPLLMPPEAISLDATGARLAGGVVRLRWASSGGATLSPSLTAVTFAATYQTPVPAAMLRLASRVGETWVAVSWFTRGEGALRAVIADQQIEIVTPDGQHHRLSRSVG